MRLAVVVVCSLTGASVARADDGYCDFVKGVASAQSALMFAPEIYAQLGYVENSLQAPNPLDQYQGRRALGGIQWRVSGLYEGFATRARAGADCRRHEAFEQIRGETLGLALAARLEVLEGAMAEANKLAKQADDDLDARRTTAQEATATRLRVEELRRLVTETRATLRALPASRSGSLPGAIATYQRADAELESNEARIRRAQAFDLNLRVGFDEYLDRDDNPSIRFAMVTLGVNLGALFQSSGNDRAAKGRARLVKTGRDSISVEGANVLIEATAQRAKETAALEADLARQIEALGKVGGDDSRRYRLIVWFDWVKIRAEHAFHEAHLAALRQVVGGGQ